MSSILRILDANANRAREALRVMEEAARLHLEDGDLTESLKELRHDLARALASFDDLDFDRDMSGDVGTSITTATESRRESIRDVATAAGKRLSEALRALEEYGKTINAGFSADSKKLRYRGYELERRLNGALSRGRGVQWRICVILSESLCTDGQWFKTAEAVIEAGADCIQLREQNLDDRELFQRAMRLRDMIAGRCALVINNRPDIAMLAGADGVHLGQHDLPCPRVRKMVGRKLLIGVSTSRLDEARQALRDGADYCGVGPIFPSTTKRKDTIAGSEYLREYLSWNMLPHLAISGITPENVHQLVAVGCRGVAVSSAVCSAVDAGAVVCEFNARLEQARSVVV